MCQALYKINAVISLRYVATVQHDIAAGTQCIAPRTDAGLVFIEVTAVKFAIADIQRAATTVRQNLHRIKILVRAQDRADLIHAVEARIEHDDIGVTAMNHLQSRT